MAKDTPDRENYTENGLRDGNARHVQKPCPIPKGQNM